MPHPFIGPPGGKFSPQLAISEKPVRPVSEGNPARAAAVVAGTKINPADLSK